MQRAIVETICGGFSITQRRRTECHPNQSAPVPSPAALTLRMDASVPNTKSKRTSATRSSTGILRPSVATVVLGSVSVTSMFRSIHSVSCVSRKVCWWKRNRCIISSHCLKVVTTAVRTLSLFAAAVMQESTLSVVTAGTPTDR